MPKGDLGPCICGCGRQATMPKHKLNKTCYSSVRMWANGKSPKERAQQMNKLLVRQTRLVLIESKEIVIGKSPYKWRAKDANVIVMNLHRRQRGAIR